MITRLLMFLNPRNVFVHLRMMKPKERNSQQPYNQRAVVVECFTQLRHIINRGFLSNRYDSKMFHASAVLRLLRVTQKLPSLSSMRREYSCALDFKLRRCTAD